MPLVFRLAASAALLAAGVAAGCGGDRPRDEVPRVAASRPVINPFDTLTPVDADSFAIRELALARIGADLASWRRDQVNDSVSLSGPEYAGPWCAQSYRRQPLSGGGWAIRHALFYPAAPPADLVLPASGDSATRVDGCRLGAIVVDFALGTPEAADAAAPPIRQGIVRTFGGGTIAAPDNPTAHWFPGDAWVVGSALYGIDRLVIPSENFEEEPAPSDTVRLYLLLPAIDSAGRHARRALGNDPSWPRWHRQVAERLVASASLDTAAARPLLSVLESGSAQGLGSALWHWLETAPADSNRRAAALLVADMSLKGGIGTVRPATDSSLAGVREALAKRVPNLWITGGHFTSYFGSLADEARGLQPRGLAADVAFVLGDFFGSPDCDASLDSIIDAAEGGVRRMRDSSTIAATHYLLGDAWRDRYTSLRDTSGLRHAIEHYRAAFAFDPERRHPDAPAAWVELWRLTGGMRPGGRRFSPGCPE